MENRIDRAKDRRRENPKIPLSQFTDACYDGSFNQKMRPSEVGMVDERGQDMIGGCMRGRADDRLARA
jgi:hypothetical protein